MLGLQLLLDLRKADMGHGVVAVEDARDLLERRALGLDVDEVDKDKLDRVPELGLGEKIQSAVVVPSGDVVAW